MFSKWDMREMYYKNTKKSLKILSWMNQLVVHKSSLFDGKQTIPSFDQISATKCKSLCAQKHTINLFQGMLFYKTPSGNRKARVTKMSTKTFDSPKAMYYVQSINVNIIWSFGHKWLKTDKTIFFLYVWPQETLQIS